MYEINNDPMLDNFYSCWKAAGLHLNQQVEGNIRSWYRNHPHPPFLEHLSFRLGNQLFFIRIEDVDGDVRGPGSPEGLIYAAKMANGRACVMPMKNRFGRGWIPDLPGWGLLDAGTRAPINPIDFVTDETVEMTAFEVHDIAIQLVMTSVVQKGYKITAWHGHPDIEPSIWFIGESKEPEWVVVRCAKYPDIDPERPSNWEAIATVCAERGKIGHFASVSVVSAAQPFESTNEPAVPLWRAHAIRTRFKGLK